MPLLPSIAHAGAVEPLLRDAALWAPAMTELRQRHGLPGPAVPATSGSNVVFALGPDHFVKLFFPEWSREHHAERAALTGVEGRLGVPTPAIVADGEIEGWPYLVLTRVPGRDLEEVWPTLDPAQKRDVVLSLGEAIARLGALPPEGFPGGPWPEFVELCVTRHDARCADLGLVVPPELRAHLPRACAAPLGPIHADLTDNNVLVDEVDGRWRVTGLLDFADARVGPRAYEMIAPGFFLTRGDPALTRALLAGSDCHADDLTVWSMLHLFNDPRRLVGRTWAEVRGNHWPG